MRIETYRKMGVALESLPIKLLMGIDIQSPEEEKMVQELINKRRVGAPLVNAPINRAHDKTDFKNKAEELEFQKVIDERVASFRPKVIIEDDTHKFCEYCTAKGPISHTKLCTRPEKSLSDKISALKEQRDKLE